MWFVEEKILAPASARQHSEQCQEAWWLGASFSSPGAGGQITVLFPACHLGTFSAAMNLFYVCNEYDPSHLQSCSTRLRVSVTGFLFFYLVLSVVLSFNCQLPESRVTWEESQGIV